MGGRLGLRRLLALVQGPHLYHLGEGALRLLCPLLEVLSSSFLASLQVLGLGLPWLQVLSRSHQDPLVPPRPAGLQHFVGGDCSLE